MQYRDFGNTGIKVSMLGFGAMRLPEGKRNGKYYVKEDNAIEMIRRAFELGVNYIDTAYPYCHGQSEIVVGKALKGWRDRIYLSTKMPTWKVEATGDYFKFLNEQLKRLDVDHIDFYHFHALNKNYFENRVLKFNLIDQALKAKEEGLIGHISFSFHDEPEVMKEIIDTGVFESVLCQYNLLDRVNSGAMAYAKEKGLGVAVMGPVGGGRITALDFLLDSAEELNPAGEKIASLAGLALKFVFSNRDVSIALSGMENMEMVEENTGIASHFFELAAGEERIIEKFLSDSKVKNLIGCTGCRYCMPCPNGVAIPEIFRVMNYYTVTESRDNAVSGYKGIYSGGLGELADACIECGQCEEKCPQNIKIIDKLKEIHKILG